MNFIRISVADSLTEETQHSYTSSRRLEWVFEDSKDVVVYGLMVREFGPTIKDLLAQRLIRILWLSLIIRHYHLVVERCWHDTVGTMAHTSWMM